MRIVTKYITDDGKEFDTEEAALKHEKTVTDRAQNLYDRFLQTYSGKRLLEDHALDEEGMWEVRGEDPNCDLGGHHHNPYIGTVRGTLEKVIRWAVVKEGFWEWGSGGIITKKYVVDVA